MTIAKFRAKHGKGTYYKGDDYESIDPFTGKMSHNVITYQSNNPGSKKVYLDSGKYYFGNRYCNDSPGSSRPCKGRHGGRR